MCGVVGIVPLDGHATPEREILQRMAAAIRHRGPDDEGYYVAPGVGLGHARLSIIDVQGGRQPIHNEDKSIWITYNGEIFNYIELRQDLETRGHRFYTETDTEVIVHMYEEYGDEFVHQLNGQFAIALWDQNRRRQLLIRDRVGILPLFYSVTADCLLFSSEIKGLIASGQIEPTLDHETLDQLLTFWCPVDIQKTLQTRDGRVIRREADELLDKLWKGRGGFIAGFYPDEPSIGLAPEVQGWACDEFTKHGLAVRYQ